MIQAIWKWLKIRLFVSGPVFLGERFHIGVFSFVSSSNRLHIGKDVYIGKFCTIQCNGEIGDGVLIANNVGIVGAVDHDFREIGVCVRNATWIGDSSRLHNASKNIVRIGDDVWIGFGATVLTGVNIGRGAIVAAGAVVTKNVEPYDIVAGNPARHVGRRFTDQQISDHEYMLSRK